MVVAADDCPKVELFCPKLKAGVEAVLAVLLPKLGVLLEPNDGAGVELAPNDGVVEEVAPKAGVGAAAVLAPKLNPALV